MPPAAALAAFGLAVASAAVAAEQQNCAIKGSCSAAQVASEDEEATGMKMSMLQLVKDVAPNVSQDVQNAWMSPAGCQDTPGWTNGYSGCKKQIPWYLNANDYCTSSGWTCKGYGSETGLQGFCSQGSLKWGGGSNFNFPENNCCVCGKQSHGPPAPPPSSGDTCYGGSQPVQVRRRRRNSNMCSCRRRDGKSSNGPYGCSGNQVIYMGGGIPTPPPYNPPSPPPYPGGSYAIELGYSCPAGYLHLDSASECEQAAEPMTHLPVDQNPPSASQNPQYCYVWGDFASGFTNLYWNPDGTTSGSWPSRSVICKKSGAR